MTATREQIVDKFLSLKFTEWTNANWGLHKDRDYWNVGSDTYINGVPLIIDYDYRMGYLLEIVERKSSIVSYLVIVKDPRGHDSAWFEGFEYGKPVLVGTFFDRNVEMFQINGWAVTVIEGLLEGLDETFS